MVKRHVTLSDYQEYSAIMRYKINTCSQFSLDCHVLEIECAEPPTGFAPNPDVGFDWIDMPDELRGVLGVERLTQGFVVERGWVRFRNLADGRYVRVSAEKHPALSTALQWWDDVVKASAIARDRFWADERNGTSASPGDDYGEYFL